MTYPAEVDTDEELDEETVEEMKRVEVEAREVFDHDKAKLDKMKSKRC